MNTETVLSLIAMICEGDQKVVCIQETLELKAKTLLQTSRDAAATEYKLYQLRNAKLGFGYTGKYIYDRRYHENMYKCLRTGGSRSKCAEKNK